MGLDFGRLINDFVDRALSKPVVKTIAQSPIYTAVLIVAVLALIVTFVFRNENTNESKTSLIGRAALYTFGATLPLVLLHNRILMAEQGTAAADSIMAQSFEPVSILGDDDDIIPVKIPDNIKL